MLVAGFDAFNFFDDNGVLVLNIDRRLNNRQLFYHPLIDFVRTIRCSCIVLNLLPDKRGLPETLKKGSIDSVWLD
ncbi:hypothetical protein D3C77_612260 [compost metagenome]